ncbi:hypothetical protein FRE64_12490 [Euhalothece natronophila Z-M001]|uniref:Uncharacterized protein n=1 Tax=Euhalothece natronophila Z-M001 TaxID=522448 RepID=A0A5B8NP13_9CHRO|nr:hypothetical protein [Euhalothece natronophila]QDZ40697.1 hypothetical protein FRE64_12490 [Euhalothece natronophila Z-M001]
MLKTLEMRWFKWGEIPLSLRQWFERDCAGTWLGTAQTRTDWYLRPIAPCNYLNLKFREGRLEMKWRQQALVKFSLHQQWEGVAEKWIKWLCEEESLKEFSPEDQVWVAVEKSRQQRQFILSLDSVCNIELTALRVQDQKWWTLGLECTGDLESLHTIALQVSENCPETLTDAEAAAYPHWLWQQLF